MRKGQLIFVAVMALASVSQADNFDRFCAGIPNGLFVSSPRSCQHWIFCQNEAAVEGTCPASFYFDVATQMCRYPEFVDCRIDNVDVTCGPVDLEFHPHPDNCEDYVICVDGFPRVSSCAPGLHWDNTREICDLPQNVQCEPDQELVYQCVPGETYVTRHPNICQKFIICVDGDRRLNRCADNLLFDPENLRCDFAENVVCELPEAEVHYECDMNVDFYFAPHPYNCNYFIMCFAGQRQIERCAQGLIFDWINLQCDVPGNAWCLAPTLV